MLFEIMKEIRNFFPTTISESGSFEIEGGTIGLDFIKDGQYFIIEGSNFNDNAVFQYPADNMKDEKFNGTVTVIAPPDDFLKVVDEIEEFVKNDKPTSLTNESFGGYSYTRAVNSNGRYAGWEGAFASRLKVWRKI